MSMAVQVFVTELDADPERLDSLTRLLLSDIRGVDDVDVSVATDGQAPDGARVVDPIVIGSLIVTLLTSQGLPHLIEAIRGWLGRGVDEQTRSVKLQLDGDSLELTAATTDEQEKLVDLFVSRHHGLDPRP